MFTANWFENLFDIGIEVRNFWNVPYVGCPMKFTFDSKRIVFKMKAGLVFSIDEFIESGILTFFKCTAGEHKKYPWNYEGVIRF